MRPIDAGCTDKSEVFFYTPGIQAKQTFFYPLCAGHYYCTNDYLVQRSNYDSFLLIYVKKGSGFLDSQGFNTHYFHEGDVILADCYKPHIYGTTTDSELIWLHFDGATSREYVSQIHENSGPVFSVKDIISFENDLNKIITMISSKNGINDALCSFYIVKLLTSMLLNTCEILENDSARSTIDDVISYINNNIKNQITVEELAEMAGLSEFYFIRLFKRETGFTPHEYLIHTRINIAKFYLKSSDCPVKEICFNSGFTSESSFCSTFKRICSMTPGEYRKSSNSGSR